MTVPPDPTAFLPLPHVSFHVLLAMMEAPKHGYAIIQDVEIRSEGRLTVRSGTLYTTIQRLLEGGLLEKTRDLPQPGEDPRRKYYEITTLGRRTVAAEAERLAGLVTAARKHGSKGLAG